MPSLVAKNVFNTALRLFGLSVSRTQTLEKAARLDYEVQRHQMSLESLERAMRAAYLPRLPERKGRLDLMRRLVGCPPVKALYLAQYLADALKYSGDVCEFGVAEGATSAFLANEMAEERRHLWLYDSFQGLPKPTEKDTLIDDIFSLGSVGAYEGWMAHSRESVENRLAAIEFPSSRVHVVPGFIEKVKDQGPLPDHVAFAHVDFDFYEPVKIAIELLDPRLSSGGIIAVDDYEHFTKGPETAVHEFLASRPQYELIKPEEFAKGFVLLRKR